MRTTTPTGVDRRVTATVSSGIVIGVLMVLLGMEPRLVLLGLVVMVVGAAAWLTIDLRNAVSPIAWRDHSAGSVRASPPDRRVQVLRARLRTTTPRVSRSGANATDAPTGEIASSLVAVIDGHLTEAGLDRSTDPNAAAEFLGPELTRFVTDPTTCRAMTRPRRLAHTLGLIESL